MGSTCTCNARVCNYHKQGGYGFATEGATFDTKMQLTDLKGTLSNFMDDMSSPTAYFKTGVQTGSNESASLAALNKLRNTISGVTPIEGLTLDSFCVNINDSYKNTSDSPVSEGYTFIKPKPDTRSVVICVIIAIALFSIVGFIIYRYITCPCRKQHEKERQEAELRS